MDVETIRNYIREHTIHAEIIEHAASGLKSSDASKALGIDTAHIIKTLLFIGKNTRAVVVCLGSSMVNIKKLEQLGVKKPRLATAEELKEILGTAPGGTPPIALPADIPKFIDKKVMEQQFVVGSAGSEFAGLKIDPKDILKVSDYKIVDIAA
ncbi:MAG: YbaK/EbsC family protein [Candidatus Aenigmarchaeota archaeon]|nr:YbaK/EbsC family protein [Candidatus Aenigmarchaeota archaeon]